VWSPEALSDVEEIASYISRDSPRFAKSVVSKILSAAEGLARLPNRGRTVPETADPSIREIFVYSYRLIYRVGEKEITVAAVIHGRRLLDAEKGRLLDEG